jgi:hypothetical protein
VVYNGGDIAWTLASTALVWLMVPGIGFFYCGLLRRKNGLSMIYLSMGTVAVVAFQVSTIATPRPFIPIQCYSGSSGDSLSRSVTLRVNLSGIYVSIDSTLCLRYYLCHLYPSSRLFRAEGSSRETIYRKCTSAIDRLLCLPADVCFTHVCTSLSVYYVFAN